MRKLMLLAGAALLGAGSLLAQSQQQQLPPDSAATKRPRPLDPADVNTLTGRESNLSVYARAPKPGHPLDPNDVATLTGRRSVSQRQMPRPRPGHALDPADVETLSSSSDEEGPRYRFNVTPYGTYGYPVDSRVFHDPLFAPRHADTCAVISPRILGFSRGRAFVGFGDPAGSFFFFTNGTRNGSFFFFRP